MSESDVEYVRRSLEKWRRNDRDAAIADWAEDATMNAPKEWPEAGSSSGIDEVRAAFDGFDDAFGPDWPTHVEPQRIEDAGGGRVLVEFDWKPSGAASGISFDQELAGIYTVAAGKITRADFFTSHKDGRKAAGLE